MSDEKLEPVPPPSEELAQLLMAERSIPSLPPEVRTRIRARVSGTGGGPPAGTNGGGAPAGPAGYVTTGLAGVLVGVLATLGAQRIAESREVHAPSHAPSPAAEIASPPSAPATRVAPASAAVVGLDSADLEPPAPAPTPRRATRARPTPRPADDGQPTVPTSTLDAEREILDAARAALVRGHASQALAALDRHEREHPGGALAEEREVLATQALAALGRAGEARARRDAFHARWPASLLSAAIDRAASDAVAPP